MPKPIAINYLSIHPGRAQYSLSLWAERAITISRMIVSPTSKRFEIICKRYPRTMQNESDRYHGKGTQVRTPTYMRNCIRRALRAYRLDGTDIIISSPFGRRETRSIMRKTARRALSGYVSTLRMFHGGAPEEYFENEPITICVRPAASLSDPYSRVK